MPPTITLLDLDVLIKELHQRLDFMKNSQTVTSGLNFPTYSLQCSPRYAGKSRYSEQEARFLFVLWLEEHIHNRVKILPFGYTVETPTTLAYKGFSKRLDTPVIVPHAENSKSKKQGGASSASIDLAIDGLFSTSEWPEIRLGGVNITESVQSKVKNPAASAVTYRCLNVEFKRGTADAKSFAKDFVKLYSEEGPGLWFNYYVGDSATLAAINKHVIDGKKIALDCIAEYHRNFPTYPQINTGKTIYTVILGLPLDNMDPLPAPITGLL